MKIYCELIKGIINKFIFSKNRVGARELLKDHVFLYMIKRGINDFISSFDVINNSGNSFKKSIEK